MGIIRDCNGYVYDFEYDGERLSDFGCVVCHLDGNGGMQTVSAGSLLTFNTVSMRGGKYWSQTSANYTECIHTTFQICKDPDKYDDDMVIHDDEYRRLMRWLNRREFKQLQFFDSSSHDGELRFYDASFNVSKITMDDVLYGLELEMFTNRPFAYGDTVREVFTLETEETPYIFDDISDEIGFVYPDVKIKCKSAGNLSLKNSMFNTITIINNCLMDEVVTIDGNAMYIESSEPDHKTLWNDFNFVFPRVGNTYGERTNSITATIPCEVELSYQPIIKDVP